MKSYYYQRIKEATSFIEYNLKNNLSVGLIAEKACFSKYHFIRIFMAITGDTVGNYVRKRRISKSAEALIHTGDSILSIALEYQFDSQEAYTRSFKKIYNTTPGQYRKRGVNQLAFKQNELSDLRLEHLKNNISMEPEIITVRAKKLVGLAVTTSMVDNKIPQLWQHFMSRVGEIKNNCNTGRYGIHVYDSQLKAEDYCETLKFEKWATVEVSTFEDIPDDMNTHVLEGGKYAVFTHKGGVSGFQMSVDYVYGTWLPGADYELDTRDDFEYYGEKFYGPAHPESEVQMYIPIK